MVRKKRGERDSVSLSYGVSHIWPATNNICFSSDVRASKVFKVTGSKEIIEKTVTNVNMTGTSKLDVLNGEQTTHFFCEEKHNREWRDREMPLRKRRICHTLKINCLGHRLVARLVMHAPHAMHVVITNFRAEWLMSPGNRTTIAPILPVVRKTAALLQPTFFFAFHF